MASKKKKIWPKHKKLIVGSAAVLVAAILVYGGFMWGAWEELRLSEPANNDELHRVVANATASSLYSMTKAQAAGVSGGLVEDRNNLYDHYFTPDLAAKMKQNPVTELFCSDKAPDNMQYVPQSNGNFFIVSEDYYNAPGTVATTKRVMLTFSWPAGRIVKITCL